MCSFSLLPFLPTFQSTIICQLEYLNHINHTIIGVSNSPLVPIPPIINLAVRTAYKSLFFEMSLFNVKAIFIFPFFSLLATSPQYLEDPEGFCLQIILLNSSVFTLPLIHSNLTTVTFLVSLSHASFTYTSGSLHMISLLPRSFFSEISALSHSFTSFKNLVHMSLSH